MFSKECQLLGALIVDDPHELCIERWDLEYFAFCAYINAPGSRFCDVNRSCALAGPKTWILPNFDVLTHFFDILYLVVRLLYDRYLTNSNKRTMTLAQKTHRPGRAVLKSNLDELNTTPGN